MSGDKMKSVVECDPVVAVLNRDMLDDQTIRLARAYHRALLRVANAAKNGGWVELPAALGALDELERSLT